jgi:hypothetical protein
MMKLLFVEANGHKRNVNEQKLRARNLLIVGVIY